jgi:hypothetical protein
LAANSWLTTSLISQGYSSPEITAAIGVAQLTAFVATLVVGLLWLALRKPSWCASLLAVLVVGQMTWVHSHYLDPFDFRSAHKTNALVDKIRSDPEPVRVKFLAQDGLLHYYLWAVFPYYRIASIDIPAASRIPDDYLAFFAALEKHPLRLWQLAGVKYLALPASLLNQVLQAPELRTNIASVETFQARGSRLDDLSVSAVTDPGLATHALVTLKDFLSKVTFVPGIEVLDDQAALSRRLASPEWDPWRTFLLDQSTAVTAGLTTLPTPVPGAMAKVLLRRYSGARIEVEVESKSAGYILINDRYDTKWRARVNGEPARIVRANLIMLGLQVPVGHSKIVLDYNCPTLPIYVHLVSLAGVLFSLFIYAWRTRRKTAADSGSS